MCIVQFRFVRCSRSSRGERWKRKMFFLTTVLKCWCSEILCGGTEDILSGKKWLTITEINRLCDEDLKTKKKVVNDQTYLFKRIFI